ncbi:NIPA-like protein 2 [Esox lucius]|uniref:NIPA like domain containing 2 n=1 Tax=Esox lucius TaxID=8010 RepID=A0A3P8ZGB4_ESOLU|nr:NIPA-like protein 2 [Esox lucius]
MQEKSNETAFSNDILFLWPQVIIIFGDQFATRLILSREPSLHVSHLLRIRLKTNTDAKRSKFQVQLFSTHFRRDRHERLELGCQFTAAIENFFNNVNIDFRLSTNIEGEEKNMANSSTLDVLFSQRTGQNSSEPSPFSDFRENPLKTYLLGIIISISGNFLISISLNIQKYAHMRQSRHSSSKPYYTSWLWWCGVVLMGLGELGNFAAYGFAPASLIAPLGCVSVIASAIISVLFLKETLRASDIVGGTLAVTGTYLLVTFAPHTSTHITAHLVQKYTVSWQFLVYLVIEIIVFSVLLYLYKRRNMKNIVIVMVLVSLLASLTVISVKAVSGMITESIQGRLQLTYPIFYVMVVVMGASCAFQIKFLNQAMKMFSATEVVPIHFVFFTASAVVAGIVFYQEFSGLALLNIFMFLLGCLLSCLGVFLIARDRPKIQTPDQTFIAMGKIPGKTTKDKVQPDPTSNKYGSLAAKLMCIRPSPQDQL